MLLNPPLLANSQAITVLTDSITLAKDTAGSWEKLWTTALTGSSPLWLGLVKLGLFLALCSLLYVIFTAGKELIDNQSWSELAAMFVWPLVIALLMGNNGQLLSTIVLFTKDVASAQVTGVLEVQMAGTKLSEALKSVELTSIGKSQIQALYNDCKGLGSNALAECWKSKSPAVDTIVANAKAQNNNGALNALQTTANILKGLSFGGVIGAGASAAYELAGKPAGDLFSDPIFTILRTILLGLQWCFVNILEAALILTALFAPVALGLSLLPLEGRPIISWLIGFISLFGIQLGYNIISGLTATILVQAGGESISDFNFMLFLAVFSPIIATAISTGGGIAVFQAVSNGTKGVTNTISNGLGSAINIVLASKQ